MPRRRPKPSCAPRRPEPDCITTPVSPRTRQCPHRGYAPVLQSRNRRPRPPPLNNRTTSTPPCVWAVSGCPVQCQTSRIGGRTIGRPTPCPSRPAKVHTSYAYALPLARAFCPSMRQKPFQPSQRPSAAQWRHHRQGGSLPLRRLPQNPPRHLSKRKANRPPVSSIRPQAPCGTSHARACRPDEGRLTDNVLLPRWAGSRRTGGEEAPLSEIWKRRGQVPRRAAVQDVRVDLLCEGSAAGRHISDDVESSGRSTLPGRATGLI